MKSVYHRTIIQLVRRSGLYTSRYNSKRHIDPSRLLRTWCPLPCHKWVWLNWYLSTLGWRWTASITAMFCCLSRCFQQSRVSQNVVYS